MFNYCIVHMVLVTKICVLVEKNQCGTKYKYIIKALEIKNRMAKHFEIIHFPSHI